MSEELEKVLDNYINSQEKRLFNDEIDAESKEELKSAAKARIEDIIYDEIKKECRDEIIKGAEKEIDKRAGINRITEYTSLPLIGIFVAFFIGLLTNQITDIIGMLKGTVTPEKIQCTIIISIIIFIICALIVFGLFISEIIKMLERNNDERDNSRKDI